MTFEKTYDLLQALRNAPHRGALVYVMALYDKYMEQEEIIKNKGLYNEWLAYVQRRDNDI